MFNLSCGLFSKVDVESYLVFQDESFAYEGETVAQSIVESGENQAEIQDGSNHRRIGIADCLYVACVKVITF